VGGGGVAGAATAGGPLGVRPLLDVVAASGPEVVAVAPEREARQNHLLALKARDESPAHEWLTEE
jgi:hypothetical protein